MIHRFNMIQRSWKNGQPCICTFAHLHQPMSCKMFYLINEKMSPHYFWSYYIYFWRQYMEHILPRHIIVIRYSLLVSLSIKIKRFFMFKFGLCVREQAKLFQRSKILRGIHHIERQRSVRAKMINRWSCILSQERTTLHFIRNKVRWFIN